MSNKHMLRAQIKSTGICYALLIFLFGTHFAYLNKWGLQILFWITLWGFGLWWFIELFMIPGRVERHNALLYAQIDEIEKKEKRDDMLMMQAISKGVAIPPDQA